MLRLLPSQSARREGRSSDMTEHYNVVSAKRDTPLGLLNKEVIEQNVGTGGGATPTGRD
jgi:hypothetical protein